VRSKFPLSLPNRYVYRSLGIDGDREVLPQSGDLSIRKETEVRNDAEDDEPDRDLNGAFEHLPELVPFHFGNISARFRVPFSETVVAHGVWHKRAKAQRFEPRFAYVNTINKGT